jgi:hypothetical protein
MDAMITLAWDLSTPAGTMANSLTLKVPRTDPQSFNSRIWLAMSYAFKGDHRKAVEECDALENAERGPGWDGVIGSIYAVSGRRDKALQVLDVCASLRSMATGSVHDCLTSTLARRTIRPSST